MNFDAEHDAFGMNLNLVEDSSDSPVEKLHLHTKNVFLPSKGAELSAQDILSETIPSVETSNTLDQMI